MKTLAGKFFIFIIIPVVFISSALSLSSYLLVHNLLINQMKESGRNFLRASAEGVSTRIARIQTTLKIMAITENLGAENEFQQHRLFVEAKKQLGGAVTSVFMGFPDGRFIRAKTSPLPMEDDPRARPG